MGFLAFLIVAGVLSGLFVVLPYLAMTVVSKIARIRNPYLRVCLFVCAVGLVWHAVRLPPPAPTSFGPS